MDTKQLGTYRLGRRPEIDERVMVCNNDNIWFGYWGVVIKHDQEFDIYEVALESDTKFSKTEERSKMNHLETHKWKLNRWFAWQEIAWDSGH